MGMNWAGERKGFSLSPLHTNPRFTTCSFGVLCLWDDPLQPDYHSMCLLLIREHMALCAPGDMLCKRGVGCSILKGKC